MKKYISFIAIILAISFMFMACSDDNANDNQDDQESIGENNGDTNDSQNDSEDIINDIKDDMEEDEEEGDPDKWGENELDLSMGDTATKHNNFSKLEITFDSAEMVDDEDYEESYYGQYVIVNLTVKNIGDDSVDPMEGLHSVEIVSGDRSGGEMWDIYDDLSEGWPDEIEEDEEASGPLVFDVKDTDEYELQMGFGLESVSNKVSYKFKKDEID